MHGDWGAGKTSFLCQLQHYLTGECPRTGCTDAPKPSAWKRWRSKKNVTVVWFEAWQYQHEAMPVVALLNEIREAFSTSRKFLDEMKKLGEVALKSSLLNMESVTKMIGFKASAIEKTGIEWEQRQQAYQLPSQQIRDLLQHAIGTFLGKQAKNRLVIIIDDLDRCDPKVAYKLLEGLKIYLNLPNCVFVLGMDQRQIEDAIAQSLPEGPIQVVLSGERKTDKAHLEAQAANARGRAREYLEKICQDIVHLPEVRSRSGLLQSLLLEESYNYEKGFREVCAVVEKYDCLPANPRKIKAFANVLERFVHFLEYQAPKPDVHRLDKGQGKGLDREACVLVLMAGLYHFHHRLFAQLAHNPAFFEEILKFAEDGTHDHEVFAGLVRAILGTMEEDPDINQRYPHPGDGNIFRLSPLVLDIVKLAPSELKTWLEGDI